MPFTKEDNILIEVLLYDTIGKFNVDSKTECGQHTGVATGEGQKGLRLSESS